MLSLAAVSRIRIADIDDAPLDAVRYLNAARGGGSEVAWLPIVRAHVGPLADELDAIIACSDLQGLVPRPAAPSELLGIEVAIHLRELADQGALPPAARTGVLLGGDLFSVPDKRGGYGDVADVWEAFAERFAWVAGVAGNHDDMARIARSERVHVLDGEVAELDGLRIGGVGYVAGNAAKLGRRDEDVQRVRLERAIDAAPDILLLHEGPDGSIEAPGQRGSAAIRELVEVGGVGLTICGHVHWDHPLAVHEHGQILNVDARVVVLVSSKND